ncbi:hypothetical protein EMGBD1_15320, partial [Anaerolineaceae bacterium]
MESQRPEQVPFDLAAELHLTFDNVAINYRRAMHAQALDYYHYLDVADVELHSIWRLSSIMSTPTKSRLLRGRGFLLAPIALIVLYYGAYFFLRGPL